MTRRIEGKLLWARSCERPGSLKCQRARGPKAKGLRYEEELARELEGLGLDVLHGQWFQFADRRGSGVCQVDLILPRPAGLLVLESKLTWTPEALRQLELYLPVVSLAFGGVRTIGMQVCRNLVPGLTSTVVGDLARGEELAGGGREVCWHWLGRPRRKVRRSGHQTGLARAEALL